MILEPVRNFLLLQFNKPRWIKRSFGIKSKGIAYVKYQGKKFYLFLGDLYGPSYHLMHWGVSSYEPYNQKFIKKVLGQEGVFLDIGANIGIFSIVASMQSSEIKAYAFDPDENARECLTASVVSNRISNIEILPYAVSGDVGSGVLYLDSENHGGNSLNQESIPGGQTGLEQVNVQLTTVDRFVSDRGLKQVDLIKIDVQEHEFDVLKGATKSLRKYRPVVLVECNTVNIGGDRDIFKNFEGLDYMVFDPIEEKSYSLDSAREALREKSGTNKYFDLFFFPVEKAP
ncbi:hypothetical protein AZI87_13120 [Bdellovibrio bacteriovorus]|uniref:Methyltransferase FkbM domain-containing protein n=1 Tax=Bdellovibrio bacteriovorus TaxID=959 RepID=A0A162G2V7_BDEBC|nr:FkbM family methyltransferase [Bdellovibrio bacteriovorus]KYG64183.1 hypothetical protein AZI87_13120 [Bdellovibrio bacteriovorus]